MKKRTIYGPPGTGKTTYLMSLIMEDLKTIKPNRIAFVSYTKQGTYEGSGNGL
jgi:DNA replication protein DnaC